MVLMMDEKPKTKEGLRASTSRKRRYILAHQKARFDGQIYQNILDLPEWKKARKRYFICFYLRTLHNDGIPQGNKKAV